MKLLRIVRQNWQLKLLSLSLAIIGWAYFRFAGNPVLTAHFDQQLSVPITVVNLAPGYIARFSEKEAVVTIEPKRGEPPVKADEIKAVVDLTNRPPGVYNLPVQLVAPSVPVQSLSPASITLTVERIDSRVFPVAIHYGGSGNVVVNRFVLTPNSVTVRGPTDELAQVAAVRVELPLRGNLSSMDEMIRPAAVGTDGSEIRDLQVIPNLVRVQAQFLPATH